jgi:hypothetical protein
VLLDGEQFNYGEFLRRTWLSCTLNVVDFQNEGTILQQIKNLHVIRNF